LNRALFKPVKSLPTAFKTSSILQRNSALLLAVLLLSCGHAAKPEPPNPQPVVDLGPFPEPAPKTRDADDAARFLAGMKSKPGSAFADLEQDEGWKTHQKELDAMWGRTESRSLTAMRDFQSKELNNEAIQKSPLFYPFSGPDALMMNVFFPHNSTYVMVGLEPPGTLPTPAQFKKKKDLAAHLAAERKTVNDVLGRSFFITSYMDAQFRGQVTDGLLQPILHLLVRTNHSIVGYRYVKIDETGKVLERDPNEPAAPKTEKTAAEKKAAPKSTNKGVEVDFVDDATNKVHRLYYFSLNLADDHLSNNKAFCDFVPQLKGMTSYFKATSYMTHRPEFSIIRNLVLDGSNTVLQDDSGLPYKLYTDPPWHVQLYGNYDKPIKPFLWLEQKDLRQAYQKNSPKPLNFHIGYGLAQLPSNLLLATKSNTLQKQAMK
jgi:hypothetical protein